MTLKILDLFSGIGGFSYAAERLVGGFETVAFCEIDPYCQKVLKRHWPDVPVHNDVRRLADEADGYRGLVDVVCGGYPCQGFSLAGSRKGQEDDRHLWPEMLRIIQAARPRFVIGENVAGHITLGLDTVLSDLAAEDYTARAFVIPACAKDAKHRRDRVWIVAHTSSGEWESRAKKQGSLREVPKNRREHDYFGRSSKAHAEVFSNTTGQRQQRQRKFERSSSQEKETERQADNAFTIGEPHIWATESNICRTLDGVSNRMDRIKSLGNSVLPQVVAEIFIAIKAMANDR